MFGEMYDQSIPKPCKSYGTRWTAHKKKAMEIVIKNYGIYIKHLELLANTELSGVLRNLHGQWPNYNC